MRNRGFFYEGQRHRLSLTKADKNPVYSRMELFLNVLLIFCLRVSDVSIGTLRIVMLVRGRRSLAGLFAFFESLLWLTAAVTILNNLENPLQMIAYAGGYATGTVLGSWLEARLFQGKFMVRIVSPVDTPNVGEYLHARGHYATVLNATGRKGDVKLAISVLPRRSLKKLLQDIHAINPQAFVTFEATEQANLATVMPAARVRK